MSDDEEIGSGAKGKLGEFKTVGHLLKRGFKVYTPIVDRGIDCVIDVGKGNYKEIQVKSRSSERASGSLMSEASNHEIISSLSATSPTLTNLGQYLSTRKAIFSWPVTRLVLSPYPFT